MWVVSKFSFVSSLLGTYSGLEKSVGVKQTENFNANVFFCQSKFNWKVIINKRISRKLFKNIKMSVFSMASLF